MNPSLSIGDRIESIRQTLREGVRLVAVSKFHSSEAIVEAYEAGHRLFGESRVQELVAKQEELSGICLDLNWHFIGPLQTNKVKYIAPFVQMIESVDSLRLLEEINKQALKCQRRIPVLLEVHIAEEDSKSGFAPDELHDVIEHIYRHHEEYEGVRLSGLMAMASYTEDRGQIEREFELVAQLFEQIKHGGSLVEPEAFCELSMGMSGDYDLAMAHGATLVRIGSAIFGDRDNKEL